VKGLFCNAKLQLATDHEYHIMTLPSDI